MTPANGRLDCWQFALSSVGLIAVGVVLAEYIAGEVGHVSDLARGLDTHARVVIDPVGYVVGQVALHAGDPLGTGRLLKAEVGIEATEFQLHSVESGVGQAGFVEVTDRVVTCVARQVVLVRQPGLDNIGTILGLPQL